MLEHDIDRPARRRQRLKVALIAVWSVVLLAGAIGGYLALRPSPAITISGSLALVAPAATEYEWERNPPRCSGTGGFSDITEGAAVTVKDASGKVVAVGRLGVGTPGGVEEIGSIKAAAQCAFVFQVPNVPGSDFYGVEVSHRGQITYSRQQVDGGLQLKLGG